MLQSLEFPESLYAGALPDSPSEQRFDWQGALKKELAAVGVQSEAPRQHTPVDAVFGYVQELNYQGTPLTLSSVIGENDRLVIRFTARNSEGAVVLSYLAKLGDQVDLSEATWESFRQSIERRRVCLSVFSEHLVKALDTGSLLH